MHLTDLPIPLIVVAAAVVMIIVERIRPGRIWPKVRNWWPRAILFNGIQAGSVFLAGVSYDGWLSSHRLWSLDGLGVTPSAIVGYVVHTFVYYWWHRFRHQSGFLWRWVHQLHHSPQRIEVLTSFYKHPIEIGINGVLSAVVLYIVCGLSPLAATWTMLLNGLAELFYHFNIRTPRWVGWFVQRPESHCVHHQDGVHSYNFADLPVFDWMFGTLRNPEEWDARCGLGEEAEHQVGRLLAGRDLTTR